MQLSLEMSECHIPRARAKDPATSQQAGLRSKQFSVGHETLIRAALKLYGPMTAHEMQPYTGLDYVQIDRRIAAMRRANAVQAYAGQDGAPVTRRTPSGGSATVWEAV